MFHEDQLLDTISDIAGPPEGGKPEAWIYGVILAMPLTLYGLYCVFTQQAWFFNVGIRGLVRAGGLLRECEGNSAIAIGLIFIAAGMYAHFQWFWSNSTRLFRYYEIGRLFAILLFIGGTFWLIFDSFQKFARL